MASKVASRTSLTSPASLVTPVSTPSLVEACGADYLFGWTCSKVPVLGIAMLGPSTTRSE
jgi:hypothetical protein